MKSYLLEWLLTIVVLVIPLACAVFLIPFREHSLSLLDPSIQQPYFKDDSLPILAVFIPSIVVPIACFFFYPYLLARYSKRMGLPEHPFSFHYTYWWSSCIIQSVGLTVLLSELSKRLVQAPRPDFMSRCFPDGIPDAIMNAARARNYIVSTDLCTPDTKALYEDGLQSLPSEHTSLSWCMMTVLILFFYTLRRELVAHAQRMSRGKRVERRSALVRRLIAAGLSQEQARAMVAAVPPGGSSIRNYSSGVSAVGVDKEDANLPPLPLHPVAEKPGAPEFLPPTLLGEPPLAEEVPEGAINLPPTGSPKVEHEPPQLPGAVGQPYAEKDIEAAATDERAVRNGLSSRPNAQAAAGGAAGPSAHDAAPTSATAATNSNIARWANSHVVFIAHVLVPFGWAVSVGLSRTFDHRHSFGDVFCGAVLGTVVAYAVFRMHLIKFIGYHRRWNEAHECEEMDLEAARGGNDVRHMHVNNWGWGNAQYRAAAARCSPSPTPMAFGDEEDGGGYYGSYSPMPPQPRMQHQRSMDSAGNTLPPGMVHLQLPNSGALRHYNSSSSANRDRSPGPVTAAGEKRSFSGSNGGGPNGAGVGDHAGAAAWPKMDFDPQTGRGSDVAASATGAEALVVPPRVAINGQQLVMPSQRSFGSESARNAASQARGFRASISQP